MSIYYHNDSDHSLSWSMVLEDFINFRKSQGISDRTIQDYRNYISTFFKRYPDSLTSEHKLKTNSFSFLASANTPSTYNLRFEYLSIFFKWMMDEEQISKYPLRGLKKRRNPGRFIPVDVKIIQQLIKLPDLKSFAGLRDYALILTTLDTAIRPGEALQLLPSDVNFLGSEILIPSHIAKTRRARLLPISNPVKVALKKLMRARHPDWGKDIPIFCSCSGRFFQGNSWGHRMANYSEELGYRITPYQLRHTSATLFLRNGGNAMALQKMMGHTTMEMTERYVHLVEGDIRDQHAKASPVQLLEPSRNRVYKI